MAERNVFRGWLLAGGILATPAAALGVLLLSVAVVWHSRWFGLGIVGLVSAGIIAGLAAYQNPSRAKVLSRVSWAGGIFSAVALLLARLVSPEGEAPSNALFQAVNIDSTGRKVTRQYNRWSPASLVAEVDQLSMGNALVPWLDPYIDDQKAQRIAALFGNVYGEMRASSPAHVAVGSQLGSVYLDLAGWKFRDGHGYVYLPETSDGKEKPLPVFLFLHGSLGNFKGYLWVLKELADRQGIAIVAPSFGAGNWDQRGGTETLDQWLRYCENEEALDHSNIVLAGISNGGRGVVPLWAKMPGRFRGIVCISPVFEVEFLEKAFATTAAPSEPLLIVHGGQDQRVPEKYVSDAIIRSRKLGIQCGYALFPQEDHFLLFSQPDVIVDRIESWVFK